MNALSNERMNSSLMWENPAWESLHPDPGTHSVDAVPVSRRAIKHIFTQVQAFHGAFFWGGGAFVTAGIQPLYLAAHLRASGPISSSSTDRSACSVLGR